MRVGLPIADLCAGIFAAYGVTVALLEREASGKGQWLHTSLLEAQIYMMDFQTARWTIDGEIPGQAGNFHPTSIPTGVYRTKDGHINIAVFGGKIWERFAEAMGAPEWITDERSKTKAGRSVNRDWLNAEIEKRLAANTSDYWIEKLNARGRRVRAHQQPQGSLRGAAGAAPGHAEEGHLEVAGRAGPHGPAASRSRARPPRSRARRPGAASTPRKSSPSSATAPTSSRA